MKFELYQSLVNSHWYWRLIAANGQCIAIGGEGYVRRADALNAIRLVREHAAGATALDAQGDPLFGV